MSISTEITRLQSLRNALRTKLVSMLGLSSAADLEECVTAVEEIPDNGAVTGTIPTVSWEYTIPQGYHNGGGTVAISSAEQEKIIASNIKSGVSILGVTGTLTTADSVKIQAVKSVTPTKSDQSITPDRGYDALAGVNVAAIPSAYQDVSSVDAVAENVLSGKKFVDKSGALIAGTMANNGAVSKTIDGLTSTSYTIPAGYHSGSGKVSLSSDIENALAAI